MILLLYRQLSVGPEATVSLIIGSGIAHQQAAARHPFDPEAAAAIASLTAFFVGLFTLALGLLRFGFLDSLMSRALLRGFITAVGVVVLVQQSILLLGLGDMATKIGLTPDSTTIQRLLFLGSHIRYAHPLTSAFSATILTVLVCTPYLKQRHHLGWVNRVPEVLVVVITSITVCRIGRLDQAGLDVLGQVGGSTSTFNLPLPFPSMPRLPHDVDIKAIIVNAAIITIIGFVESIAAAKSFARRHNYFVSANRELVALGIANVFGGFFQCFPAFGSVR
jgi:MFS superfamily sulfate permease-like transporter